MNAAGITHQDWLNRAAGLKPPDRLVIGGRLFAPALAVLIADDLDSVVAHALEKYTELKTTWLAL